MKFIFELKSLINKTLETGMDIDTIIGDAAYSEKRNIELIKEKNIKLVVKLNSAITQGARAKEDEFEFNKDAGMYVCKSDYMAFRKAKKSRRNQGDNPHISYFF